MKMSGEQKLYYFLGYCRRSAELLKEEGLFKDLTLKEVMELLVRETTKGDK